MKRTPNRGVKENLKPFVYKLSEPFRGATACLLHNEPTSCVASARLSPSGTGAEAKASLARAVELAQADAKPSDLPLDRMTVP